MMLAAMFPLDAALVQQILRCLSTLATAVELAIAEPVLNDPIMVLAAALWKEEKRD